MKVVVGISMAALVVFIALHRKAEPPPPTPPAARVGYLGATVLGIYGGFFSGGYTTLMTVLCTVCFSLTMMESVAVTKPVNLVSCAAASVMFFCGRHHRPAHRLAAGGGQPGRRLAGRPRRLKGGDRFVRLLFLLTVAALAVKLVVWDVILRG